MPPRSLVEMCTVVCLHNIMSLEDLGDLRYEVARPMLMKVESAEQLRRIEENSPQIQGEDAEAWRRLIARDFPIDSQKKNYRPRNPRSWHVVYAKYRREEREALAVAERQLRESFAGLQKEKEQHLSKIVNSRALLAKVPRSAGGGAGGAGRRGGPAGTSRLGFGGGTRTNGTDGKSVMSKVRREVKEISRRQRLSTPSTMLAARPGQIKKAPEAMINDHRIASQPPVRIRPPTKKRQREDAGLADREARLLEVKRQKRPEPVEVEDEDEDEDLFGYDREARLRAAKRQKRPQPVEVDDEDEDEDLFGDDREARLLAAKRPKRSEPVGIDDEGEEEDLFGERDSSPLPSMSPPHRKTAPAAASARRVVAPAATRPTQTTARKGAGILSNAYRPESQVVRRVIVADSGKEKASKSSPPRPARKEGHLSPGADGGAVKDGDYDRKLLAAKASPSVARGRSRTPKANIRPPRKSQSPSPARSKSGSPIRPRASSPLQRPVPAPAPASASAPTPSDSAPDPATAASLRKKKTVDIFMRPKKPVLPRR